ncbi:MAG: HEAT repeat domain-containing protein [Phycisphaeraceae bacterium]|nr:HEAT repeat domain-containing protein [Phycisphaeraceae bacterium]
MPSRRYSRFIRSTSAAIVITAATIATPTLAQPQNDDVRLLKDFIHYVLINQGDQAKSTAAALMDRGLTPTEFAKLVESSGEASRFQKAVIDAGRFPDLEPFSAKLLAAYERGKLDQARDPGEISKNIGMLVGTGRQRQLAQERLLTAGEYAMPQLLQALLQRTDPVLAAEVRTVIFNLRSQAVIPLVTAMAGLDAVSQENLASLLGEIGSPTALAYLYELHDSTTSQPVRSACETAVKRIAGQFDPSVSPSRLYRNLAEGYYAESPSLTSFPNEDQQLLWSFDPGLGLIPTAIRSELFHEAMAMRQAESALRLDAANRDAMALWLAANFRREIETPGGYENPVYPAGRRDAMYYAVAAGPEAEQAVLARAEDAMATQLARRAIAALERTAGADGLVEAGGSRRPLLEALRYPDRRVQYEAAMVIGSAQPRTAFDGSEQVVPILGSAVRDAAARYAVVIAGGTSASQSDAAERQAQLTEVLKSKGYDVRVSTSTLADAAQAIAEAPGVDLVVLAVPASQTDRTIKQIRGTPKLAATPVLALLDLAGVAEVGPRYLRDHSVAIARSGLSNDQIGEAAEQLIQAAVGGAISKEEALAYKAGALRVLRDLAVSGTSTFNVGDATASLIVAMGDNRGEMKQSIAEVLSYINDKRAQVAIMDAAMGASGDERVALIDKVTSSAKRYGNLLEPRQVTRIIEIVNTTSGAEATAAAALMGALSLPNSDLIPLILNGGGQKQ